MEARADFALRLWPANYTTAWGTIRGDSTRSAEPMPLVAANASFAIQLLETKRKNGEWFDLSALDVAA